MNSNIHSSVNVGLDLKLEILEDVEAPMSDEFWIGVGIGGTGAIGLIALGVAVFT